MHRSRFLLSCLVSAVLATAAFVLAAPMALIAAVSIAPALAWAFEHRLKTATWDAAPSAVRPAARFTAPQTGAPEVTAFA